MDILASLGVDSSVFIQLGIFLVTFLLLYFLVFSPYFKAFEQRELRTVGSQQSSEELILKAQELEKSFEEKAKAINAESKSIYDKLRSEALQEYDQISAQAKSESKELLATKRQFIKNEISKVKKEIGQQAPAITDQIVSKLLNR